MLGSCRVRLPCIVTRDYRFCEIKSCPVDELTGALMFCCMYLVSHFFIVDSPSEAVGRKTHTTREGKKVFFFFFFFVSFVFYFLVVDVIVV